MAESHFSESWESAHHETERVCVYCGLYGDSIDHVPSKADRERILALGIKPCRFVTVYACRECNSVLGMRPLWTLTERRAFIKHHLRQRHAHLLHSPSWSEHELAKLGPGLRGRVLRLQEMREVIRARIAYDGPLRVIE